MRSLRCLAAFCAVFASVIVLADTKAELDAVYVKLNAAMKAKDLTGIMAFCTKDFQWADSKAKMTRADMEKQLKGQFSFIKKVTTVTVKIDKVTVKGTEATARTQSVFAGDIVLSDPKKLSKLKSTSTTDDTWIKSGGKWLLKKVVVIKDETTIDGKPVGG